LKFKLFKSRPPRPLVGELCLIVQGTTLLYADQQSPITHNDDSTSHCLATELAAAARRLLPNVNKRHRLALALPNSEFVATSLHLPTSIAQENLRNAVSLQLPTLLPGITEPLLLAVQPAHSNQEATIALWIPMRRAEELFNAFEKVGLFLVSILPRALLAVPQKNLIKGHSRKVKEAIVSKIYDEDEATITCCEWSGTTLQRWLHLPKIDCELPEFKSQLEQFLADIEWIRKTELNDWQNLAKPAANVYGYAFTPRGVLLRVAKARRRKNWWLTVIAILLLVVCLLAGLVYAIRYERRLEGRLAALKNRTLDVSKLQKEVVEIEEMIAPVKKFPQQNVIAILDTLNKLIPKDTWLSSFRIETGNIDIEGYSPNSAKLLELLTTEKTFTEVSFSRPTRPERGQESFGIRFKLAGFDLPSYWSEHFDTERR